MSVPNGRSDRQDIQTGPTRSRELLDTALADGPSGVIAMLAAERGARGLSYRALAQSASISSATLQGWLTGKYVPQLSMRAEFLRLVEVLGLVDPPGTPQSASAEQWWEALRGPSRPRVDIPSPYPGMRPYDLGTAAAFPGRTELVESIRVRLEERLAGQGSPLLMVTGRSGVGKSSAVAAAVAALPEGTRSESHNPGAAAAESLQRLARGEVDVLVLDHTEMLWAETDPQVRADILHRLVELDQRAGGAGTGSDSSQVTVTGTAVVLVMRADAVAPSTDVEVLRRTLENSSVVVGPVTAPDVVEIITGPPRTHGIAVEQGLTEIILRDLGAHQQGSGSVDADELVGALPLLSQTMRALWEQRSLPDRLTVADYQRTGGISTSVEVGAEAAYTALSPTARSQVWPVVREMIRLDAPIPMRRVVPSTTWEDETSWEVLDTFLRARLLMRDPEGISLSHDLLLSMWPRLAGWLSRAREWSTARRMLSRFANFWHESGRPQDLLSSRTAAVLLEAEELEQGTDASTVHAPLTKIERDFLEASRAAQVSQLEAAEAENRRLRASRWRFGLAAIATSVALVIALVAAGLSIRSGRQLNEARAAALSGEISARSETIGETMPAEASQLAVAAYHLDDNRTTRSQLISLTASPLPRRLVTPVGPGALDSADGMLAKVGTEGTILVIDPVTGAVRERIMAPASDLYSVSLMTTDGRTLLAASGEDGADVGGPSDSCVWDVTAAPRELGCVTVPGKSDAVEILEDGAGMMAGAADGSIQRAAIEGDEVRPLAVIAGPTAQGAEQPSEVMEIAAAGGTVLVAGRDGALRLLRDPLGTASYASVLNLSSLLSVELSPDGTRFAASTRDNTLLLGTVDGDTLTLDGHQIEFESWVNDAVFLPDGRVAAVSSDQTLRLMETDGTAAEVQEHPALLTSVAVSDGALATYAVDGVVNMWPAEAFPAPTPRGRLFEVTGDIVSGRITASLGEDDGVLHVERMLPDGTMRDLEVPSIDVRTSYGIGVSADGRYVATGGWDGDVFVWPVGEEALAAPLFLQALPTGALITYVKFDPSGTRMAVSAQNHDEVLVFALEPDESAPASTTTPPPVVAEQIMSIPVASGSTMTFLDEHTLVLDNGLDGLEVWDVDEGEKLSTVTPTDVEEEDAGARPSFVLARPGHPGQIGFTTPDLTVGILDLSDPSSPRLVSALSALSDTPLSLAFSPDGSQMAIAAVSHARVHDVDPSGVVDPQGLQLSGPVSSHITDVQFLEDGTRLSASTYSGKLWRWDLDPDRAAATLCTETGARLSIADARALAPSLPEDAALCG